MLLLTTSHKPATDLGYLLHKNPERIHEAKLSFGSAFLAYPEANEDSCTAVLLLHIDPVGLVRRKGSGGSLAQYVSDRPYVASSYVSVVISEMLGTALSGRSKERQALVETPIAFEVRLPVLPCRSGSERLESLFRPLGYEVSATRLPLDANFPEWGPSEYYDVTLRGTVLLRDLLRHLYLLLPVLDARKHYYMDQNEVAKLVSKGEGWLQSHPQKDWIVRSSLGRRPSLVREALEQLANVEDSLEMEDRAVDEEIAAPEQETVVRAESLHSMRHKRIVELVRAAAPKSLVDLGCGDGKLLRLLVPIQGIEKLVGMDVSYFELEKAQRKLRLEDAGPRLKERVQLLHGSLMYRDTRLEDFDLATASEVIEHLEPHRLHAFERVVFEFARPSTLLVTTPNREYNAVYGLDGRLRHLDHRFEWDRNEFTQWVDRVATRFGYRARIEGIGEDHPEFGTPSQLAVFER